MRQVAASKTRIGGSRTRTGCTTCKKRRIKCDEGRPYCLNCQASKRECGYTPVFLGSQMRKQFRGFINYYGSPAIDPRPQPKSSAVERRALDYVSNCTIPEVTSPFSNELWNVSVLRAATQEPAIQNALVSLGLIHEAFQTADNADMYNDLLTQGLRYYGTAIACTREAVQSKGLISMETTVIALTTSVLFTVIEILQGHYYSSMQHIKSGMNIMSTIQVTESQTCRDTELVELDLLRAFFVTSGAQILSIKEYDGGGAEWLNGDHDDLCNHENHKYTLVTASLTLTVLSKDIMQLTSAASQQSRYEGYPNNNLLSTRHRLRQRMTQWKDDFDSFATSPEHFRSKNQPALLLLRMNYIAFDIFLRCAFNQNEAVFDAFLNDFARIVLLAEEFLSIECNLNVSSKPLFTIQFGVISPLYAVCSRCRNPGLRRKALTLIKSSKRREFLWDACLISKVAQEVIASEEKSVATRGSANPQSTYTQISFEDPISVSSTVPPDARIARLDLSSLTDESVELVFIDNSGKEQKSGTKVSWNR